MNKQDKNKRVWVDNHRSIAKLSKESAILYMKARRDELIKYCQDKGYKNRLNTLLRDEIKIGKDSVCMHNGCGFECMRAINLTD